MELNKQHITTHIYLLFIKSLAEGDQCVNRYKLPDYRNLFCSATVTSCVADSFGFCVTSHLVNYLPAKSCEFGFRIRKVNMASGWHPEAITEQCVLCDPNYYAEIYRYVRVQPLTCGR
jgi:hypothetical protein